MRWQGRTWDQKQKEYRSGVRVFAFVPIKLSDGNWVWLEHYYARLDGTFYPSWERTLYRPDDMDIR